MALGTSVPLLLCIAPAAAVVLRLPLLLLLQLLRGCEVHVLCLSGYYIEV